MQWQENMQLIDANVMLRYLLNDHPVMSQKAKLIIASTQTYTKPEIISEVVYVLNKVYHMDKKTIRTCIHSLLDDISCTEKKCVLYVIDIHASISLDFVDCMLIAYHKINHENIFSFDNKLNKHLNNPLRQM